MGAIDKFRAVCGDMAIRSVHHNVARLDAARAFLKSENWPPNGDVMDFGATMKGRTGGLESNGPEAGNRRKFLATAAAAGAAGAGRIVRSTRTTELVRDRRNIERQTPTLVAHGPGK